MQSCLDRITDGSITLGPARAYTLDQFRHAHHCVETNTATGTLVVLIDRIR